MSLQLSQEDIDMLNGKEGEARQIAMRVIVRMAEIAGANRFIDIERAHIDACGYPGTGALALAERLAAKGGCVKVKTTMNAISEDPQSERLVRAFVQMGAAPTMTCAPYQLPDKPRCGEHIAWGESNAIVFANSVLGARTNRYGDGMDICAALTGRVPFTGFHLDENRKGSILIQVPNLPIDASFYPVLGYLIGDRVPRCVPVIEGITSTPTDDELKSFAAALASSGAIALFHMVGVTPEAPTREAAFEITPEKTPSRETSFRSKLEAPTNESAFASAPYPIWRITKEELRDAYMTLSQRQAGPIDAIVFGSPHLSLSELSTIAEYTRGLRRHRNVEVIVTTNRHAYEEAGKLGVLSELQRFGARCLTDTCPCFLHTPTIPGGANVILTPSAKYAHYGPGLLNKQVSLASLEECLNAAVSGEFQPSLPAWLEERI